MFVFFSCKKKTDCCDVSYDSNKLIQNWADSIYLPSVLSCLNSANEIKSNNYFTSRNLSDLESVKYLWVEFSKSWRGVELFIIGDVRNSFLSNRIDTWPIDTNDIKTLMFGSENISEEWISGKPSNNVGLYALEYLLYSTHLEKNNRYYDFVEVMSKNLLNDMKALKILVDESEEEFRNSSGKTLSSTIGQVLNQIPVICEEALRYKLAIPAGYYEYIEMNPKMLEAWKSKTSHVILEYTLKHMRDVFYGKQDGVGIDDYLASEGDDELIAKADLYFEEAEINFSSLKKPMFSNLNINQQKMIDLRLSFKKIRSLIMTDIAPDLGYIITFSDSDGD